MPLHHLPLFLKKKGKLGCFARTEEPFPLQHASHWCCGPLPCAQASRLHPASLCLLPGRRRGRFTPAQLRGTAAAKPSAHTGCSVAARRLLPPALPGVHAAPKPRARRSSALCRMPAPHPLRPQQRRAGAAVQPGGLRAPVPRLQINFNWAAREQGRASWRASALRVISMRVFISFTDAASLCKATERV